MLNHCLSASEFDLADTETTNFWQRSRHSLDFSLILDFAHAQQTENKFSFVFAQSQNCFVSFGQAKEMKENENIDFYPFWTRHATSLH